MLAIRLQRTGRRGHAQFRMIVQDSHFHPTRGRVVAYLGSFNPHTKTTTVDKDLAQKYLSSGAQPSDRVIKILENEGVKMPTWVKPSAPIKRSIRNPDKLRRNRPAGEAAPKPATTEPTSEEAQSEPVAPSEEAVLEQAAPSEEVPAEEVTEPPAEAPAAAVEETSEESTEPETPAEAAEAPAESSSDDEPKS